MLLKRVIAQPFDSLSVVGKDIETWFKTELLTFYKNYGFDAQAIDAEIAKLQGARDEAHAARFEAAIRRFRIVPMLDEAIAMLGEMPLPPYIAGKRGTDEKDKADYQTIFAEKEGAVPRDGLGMLVEQAAESFQLWRGVRPPTGPVLADLRALLTQT